MVTHQTLEEPGWTRYDDEELFDQLGDEGELRILGSLVCLRARQRQADRGTGGVSQTCVDDLIHVNAPRLTSSSSFSRFSCSSQK